jgi:hypothetical protein
VTESQALTTWVPIEQDLKLADIYVKSGFFADTKSMAQAVVKIQAGREIGVGAFASMQGIFVNERGRVGYAANLVAALISRSGKYQYRVRVATDKECQVEFFQGKESLGRSVWTIAMAEQAKLTSKQPWQAYPQAMLFARAMTQGQRRYCADVTNGIAMYTPEELDAADDTMPEVPTVDVGTGEIVAPAPEPPKPTNGTNKPPASAQTTTRPAGRGPFYCAKCGQALTKRLNVQAPDGTLHNYEPLEIAQQTYDLFGKVLCWEDRREAVKAKKAADALELQARMAQVMSADDEPEDADELTLETAQN